MLTERQQGEYQNSAGSPIIGVWSTTDRRGFNNKFRQVSRLGMPLVNEVVIPIKDKDRFNASNPRRDAQFLDYVTKPELPKVIEAVYGFEAPEEPRNDLVSVFLTGVDGLNQPKGVRPSEQLRLNTSTPVTADPNGSACSLRPRASPTADGSVTTSSTSRCRYRRGPSSARSRTRTSRRRRPRRRRERE